VAQLEETEAASLELDDSNTRLEGSLTALQAEAEALKAQLRDAADATAGSAQLDQELRALRSAVGDKETALTALKVRLISGVAASCGRPFGAQRQI